MRFSAVLAGGTMLDKLFDIFFLSWPPVCHLQLSLCSYNAWVAFVSSSKYTLPECCRDCKSVLSMGNTQCFERQLIVHVVVWQELRLKFFLSRPLGMHIFLHSMQYIIHVCAAGCSPAILVHVITQQLWLIVWWPHPQ